MKRQRVRSEVYRARRLELRKKTLRWARRFPRVVSDELQSQIENTEKGRDPPTAGFNSLGIDEGDAIYGPRPDRREVQS